MSESILKIYSRYYLPLYYSSSLNKAEIQRRQKPEYYLCPSFEEGLYLKLQAHPKVHPSNRHSTTTPMNKKLYRRNFFLCKSYFAGNRYYPGQT
jgi:hypothetical protein